MERFFAHRCHLVRSHKRRRRFDLLVTSGFRPAEVQGVRVEINGRRRSDGWRFGDQLGRVEWKPRLAISFHISPHVEGRGHTLRVGHVLSLGSLRARSPGSTERLVSPAHLGLGHGHPGKRVLQGVDKFEGCLKARMGILGKGTREHLSQCAKVCAGNLGERFGDVIAGSRNAMRPQQLVDQRREAEHISAAIPLPTADPLGRGIWPTHRGGHANTLERTGNADASDPRFVGRQQNVARMQRTVCHVDDGREVERAGQLRGHAKRVDGRSWTILAHRQIERFGSDVILREIRGHVGDPGRERHCHRGMVQFRLNEVFESGHELMHTLGWQIQLEEFDRNQSLASGVISTKHRSQRPRTNLMKNTKRPERVWGRGTIQRRLLVWKALKFNMVDSFRDALRQ